MASVTHNRFHQIDHFTEIQLLEIEGRIDYEFGDPVLLWEALQIPGSIVESEDFPNNQGLADIGYYAIQLAFGSNEYIKDNIADVEAYRQRRNTILQGEKIPEAGSTIGLLEVIGDLRHDRGRQRNVVIVEVMIKAVVGAVYMDSGMKAVKRLLEKLGVIEAPE